jgi:hypothetical protein
MEKAELTRNQKGANATEKTLNELQNVEIKFMTERLKPQDMTKIINFYGDLLYVLNGKIKVYMQDIKEVREDGNLVGMELQAGDYLDPYCSIDHFPTQRLKSINKRIRENRIIKMTI